MGQLEALHGFWNYHEVNTVTEVVAGFKGTFCLYYVFVDVWRNLKYECKICTDRVLIIIDQRTNLAGCDLAQVSEEVAIDVRYSTHLLRCYRHRLTDLLVDCSTAHGCTPIYLQRVSLPIVCIPLLFCELPARTPSSLLAFCTSEVHGLFQKLVRS